MVFNAQADRIQRAQDGGIELVFLQPKEWETEPHLVKSLRERVAKQQEQLADPQFRIQYRAHSAQIILETMFAPPPEIRRWLVTEGIELRPLDPEEEGPPAAIDRVQESGTLAEIILIQPLDWEADPFLMRQLRERVQIAIAYTTSSAFRKRYPKKQPSFVLEVMFAPPADLRDLLVDLGFMQIRPCEESRILNLFAQQRSNKPSPPAPSKPTQKPAASAPAEAKASPSEATPSSPSSQKSDAIHALASSPKADPLTPKTDALGSKTASSTQKASPPQKAPSTKTKAASVSLPPSTEKADDSGVLAASSARPVPSVGENASASSVRTAPPSIPASEAWEDDIEEEVAAPLATGPHLGMAVSGGVLLLFGLLWLGYALFFSGGPSAPSSPQIMQASEVSNKTVTSFRIAQIAVRPDRMTFAILSVRVPKTQKVESYALFADREHRQLLILAPVQASQILKEWKDVVTNPEEPDRITRLPVWQDDLQDPNHVPAARTYTGLLKTLRLRPSGPLELELPDENINVNEIPALRKLGVRFPEHSMILRVGELLPPPPSQVIPVTLSLLLAAIGAVFLLAAFRRHSPE